nr:LemA family protein [Actinobaculum suis]
MVYLIQPRPRRPNALPLLLLISLCSYRALTRDELKIESFGGVDRYRETLQEMLDTALDEENALAENYPELRASETYSSAMSAVQKYEDNVRYSRMMYNDTVTKLNRYRSQFPSMIVGALFGFRREEYFANQPGKAEMPTWS